MTTYIELAVSDFKMGQRVGRSKSVISSYENNIKILPMGILVQIATIFNVSLDYLVGFDRNEMVSVENLTQQQIEVIGDIIAVFKDTSAKRSGLSERQQKTLNILMNLKR